MGNMAVYWKKSNSTTRRLEMMNLAIRGIEGDLGPEHADTFRRDLHKDLKADYVLANPPFNDSDWHRSDEDVRWKYGLPPKGNANFAWVQHFIHHLSPGVFCFSSCDVATAMMLQWKPPHASRSTNCWKRRDGGSSPMWLVRPTFDWSPASPSKRAI